MEQKLETFLAVCRAMHYGRAAEQLNLSQPAVSKHIQALESQYGVQLFTYSGRRLYKTRQGEILEQYAESLQYNEESLLAKLHEEPKRLLRIGATKSIGDYVMLPYIQRFLADIGNQLELQVDNTEQLLGRLNQGELDFVVLEGLFDKRHYDWMLFREEPYVGICPPDHPFVGKEVMVADLFHETLILREKGSGTRKILERGLVAEGYTTDAFADQSSISSFEIIKTLVSQGSGISFVFESVVKGDSRLGRFSCPPLTGTYPFHVVYLKNTDAHGRASEFLEHGGRGKVAF
ncbi:MAG: LysR family transcriptional regulator [Acetatifactor sp.]